MNKFSEIEVVNVNSVSNILRGELDKYKSQYATITQDGIIDENELNTILNGMSDLESKAGSLKDKCVNSNEAQKLEELIAVIKVESAKMTNARMINSLQNNLSNQDNMTNQI